ncbi:uncharacterized protein CTHT_0015900 [Thermochaetoides thermophila DSM 1495]|uniref:Peptidyl-tRNA hydrolase-like protein n=1 Tax=Chaetomium thermophilum (strain DSM 1495 / CBS 144.50 / IMI 039719) TaxID=759272 RepID=G0S241_CHATD|nr:hypothetical protein CTHT_0015900 [Thermochaetoides thermophila DSM 1495]EGS23101.1 hypothetical protein CTHT_0015900 [Thermochaetoides thermophila DSM 1495]
MRLSKAATFLALPLLAAATGADAQTKPVQPQAAAQAVIASQRGAGAFTQYMAKFQSFLSNIVGAQNPLGGADGDSSSSSSSSSAKAAGAGKKKVMAEPKPIATLTLEGWRDALYAPVKENATVAEEWLVLVSGGNKTCYGRCTALDTAFNVSALDLANLPSPSVRHLHLGRLDCDAQPILCNVWSANPGSLWSLSLLPAPAPVEIHTRSFNLSLAAPTPTAQDIVTAYLARADPEVDEKAEIPTRRRWHRFENEGWLHPFDGKLAKLGLSVPVAYFFYGLNAVPTWVLMLVVSFVSRTLINRRLAPSTQPGAPASSRRS